MAETHDLGGYFFHFVKLRPTAPLIHRAPTYEIDEPYRVSNSLVIRISWGRGLVLGHWQESGWTEEDALLAALGREMVEATPDEIEQWAGAADLLADPDPR